MSISPAEIGPGNVELWKVYVTCGAMGFVLGFVMNRGSICTVTAAAALVIWRKPARLVALFECAAWAALAYSLLDVPAVTEGWRDIYWILPAAVLLGVGTYANGACIFGSVGHLGDGDVSFAFTFLGILGVTYIERCFLLDADHTLISMRPPLDLIYLALILALILLFRSAVSFRRQSEFVRLTWTMAAIGVASAFLASVASGFSITTSIGSDTSIAFAGLVISVCMVGGSFMSARMRKRRVVLRWPNRKVIARRTMSGALMGVGALLIPGGNDTLLLVGLPMGSWQAGLAYVVFAAIVVILIAKRGSKVLQS